MRRETLDAQKLGVRRETLDAPRVSRLASKAAFVSGLTSHAPWPTARLGEVIIMKRGKYITRNDTRPGNVPVILGGQEPAYYCDEANHTGPCVVVSRSGASAGFVSYWEQPIFVTDGFLFEANEQSNIRYVYYCLKANQSLLGHMQNGTGIPHVRGDDLKAFEIPLPPLPVQRRIADVLSAYDDLIENNRRRIAILEEPARLAYRKWFGGDNISAHGGAPSLGGADRVQSARTEPRPPDMARTEPRPPVANRKVPSKNSVMLPTGSNRAVILFVTICTTGRLPVLANREAFDCIVAAFRQASYWLVGRFVVMPDHIHFFCSPGTWPPYDFHKWMSFVKSTISRTFPLPLREEMEDVLRRREGAAPSAPYTEQVDGAARTAARHPVSQPARTEPRPPMHHLFQMQCWDTQLRTGESYAQKWEYVRNNPVRKGLCGKADDWPYQGALNVLAWHD